MKKDQYWILIILVLSLLSCKSTILRMSGFREPKVEDKLSIFKFLKSMNQDTNDVYALDTNLFQKFSHEPFKPNWANGFRPAQIRMYDKTGEPVLQWSICEGYLKDLKTFDSIPPINVNGLNPYINLRDDLKQYFTLSGRPANINPPEGYDYYVLVYFGKYFPRISKKSFHAVNNYMKKQPSVKFKQYKINVDVQEFWGTDVSFNTELSIGGNKK